MRVFVSDNKCKTLTKKLKLLHCKFGSIRAVCRKLNENSQEKIYENRIIALLSGSKTKALNARSVEIIEKALDKIPKEHFVDMPNEENPINKLIDEISELKVIELIEQKEQLLPLLEKIVQLSNQYIKILKGL